MERGGTPAVKSHRARCRTRRAAWCLPGLVAVGLLISGCGGSSSSRSVSRPSAANFGKQFVAFAVCMRSHGVPGYPDPQISGSGSDVQVKISPGSANPNSPAFKSATNACHALLPNGGKPAGSAHEQVRDRQFAVCMRSHGAPAFPDPDHDGAFTLPATVNQQAPQFQYAVRACSKVAPSSLSINQGSGGS